MRKTLIRAVPFALAALLATAPASAQCPANDYDGDEPDDFTHWIDTSRPPDGVCDEVAAKVDGVYPNGLYATCDLPGGGQQLAHGHWEYTHLQRDPQLGGETEEKDYLTQTQGMEEDFGNQDPQGTATRRAFEETMRFGLNEPKRFDRFLRPSANPEGRYWQVDEWVGPAGSPGEVPGLTWTERFFVCGSQDSPVGTCTTVDGRPAYGGYWSDHAQRYGYQADCGDPLVADPAFPRNAQCGLLFTECGAP